MKSSAARFCRRTGFTLVELLVVIAIIGILTAILVPTLAVAIRRTREAAIRFEMKQLEMAMEEYKTNNGLTYPTDFSGVDEAAKKARLNAVLKKISPNNVIDVDVWWDEDQFNPNKNAGGGDFRKPNTLGPGEAMVFWLLELQTNKLRPFPNQTDMSAADGDGNGSLSAAELTALIGAQKNGSVKLFEFDPERLYDFDGDGWLEYVPRYGEKVPFVYFDSRTYDIAGYDPTAAINGPVPDAKGVALSYARAPGQWNAEEKFQILSAGYDGDYGENRDYTDQTKWKLYPTANAASLGNLGDRDNFSSIAEGRLDKGLE